MAPFAAGQPDAQLLFTCKRKLDEAGLPEEVDRQARRELKRLEQQLDAFNAPLPPRTGGEGFRAAWRERLLPVVDAFRPQLLLISAGFDAHRRDPLAHLASRPAVVATEAVSRYCVRIWRIAARKIRSFEPK